MEEGIFLGDDDEDTDDTTEEAGDDDEIKGDSILVLPERVDLVPLLVPNLFVPLNSLLDAGLPGEEVDCDDSLSCSTRLLPAVLFVSAAAALVFAFLAGFAGDASARLLPGRCFAGLD